LDKFHQVGHHGLWSSWFVVLVFVVCHGFLTDFYERCVQIQLKDYHFSHQFKQACQHSVVEFCSSGQREVAITK